MSNQYQVVVVGAGTGGIMTAARLRRANKSLSIAIIDPADRHYYQPAFTLVGAGTYDYQKTWRSMESVIPAGTTWLQESVTRIEPDENMVQTSSGQEIQYEILVLSPGLIYDYSKIEGLKEAMDAGIACSNYIDPEHTWKCLQEFKGGNAVFTQPTTPIKCGGAPQKALYMSADYFRKSGKDKDTNLVFATPGSVIFGVKEIANTLMEVIHRYGVHFKPFYAPVKIDVEQKIIHFKAICPDENQCVVNEGNVLGETMHGDSTIEMPFDFLHLAPPQVAPRFIVESGLANAEGWLDVDIHSLQHNRYKNIFGLGDVAALPTAKTGAAIRKQAPLIVENILKVLQGNQQVSSTYDGYSSCPLVTGYGKMALAEFNYKNEFTPDPMLKLMLIRDSSKEHWRLWMFKKYGLPFLYWNRMMKGKM